MPVPGTAARATTGRGGPHLPVTARRLRIPLHSRSQARMAQRWGFDLNAADAPARAEALLAAAPADPDRLLLAAAVRSSRGDDDGALAAARQAVAGDQGSARAHSSLAALLARGGDLAGAARHAARAVELDPTDPGALYNRGLAAWTLGDHRAARADFEAGGRLLGFAPVPWWQRWRGTG